MKPYLLISVISNVNCSNLGLMIRVIDELVGENWCIFEESGACLRNWFKWNFETYQSNALLLNFIPLIQLPEI